MDDGVKVVVGLRTRPTDPQRHRFAEIQGSMDSNKADRLPCGGACRRSHCLGAVRRRACHLGYCDSSKVTLSLARRLLLFWVAWIPTSMSLGSYCAFNDYSVIRDRI
jgi:hypothetical protein